MKDHLPTCDKIVCRDATVDEPCAICDCSCGGVKSADEASVLIEAQGLVHGPRVAAYGPPAQHFAQVADLWHAAFGWDVKTEDVWQALVLLKIARERATPSRDNRVDVAGYAEAGDWAHREGA